MNPANDNTPGKASTLPPFHPTRMEAARQQSELTWIAMCAQSNRDAFFAKWGL